MSLIEAIERHRFLGREFLIFLWFESEHFEGEFRVGPHRFKLWFEGRITLEVTSQEREVSKLEGVAPSATSEAQEALRQGKYPTHARLGIEYNERTYIFMLCADSLSLSGVKIPALMKDQEDERFFERMYLFDELESLVDGLYAQFLALRLSSVWENNILGAIRSWIIDGEFHDLEAYRTARQLAEPLGDEIGAEWAAPENGMQAVPA